MDSITRFWRTVRKTDGCWFSQLSKDNDGYAQISRNGQRTLAHRFSWWLHNGAIPRGMCVLHKCDTPACVSPEHLFLGTQQDNIRDRDAKGRTNFWEDGARQGSKNPRATITEKDVRDIRRARARGVKRKILAKQYGFSKQGLDAIIYRKSWKHVR